MAPCALRKAGGGTLTLTAANTYAGGTTLNAGQLSLGNASALGTGRITINGGAIDNTTGGDVSLSANNPQTWNGDFTYVGSAHNLNLGTGAVTLAGNSQLTVSANTLTVGGVISGAHSLAVAGPGTLALTAGNIYTGGTSLASNATVKTYTGMPFGTGTVNLAAGTTVKVDPVPGLTGLYYLNSPSIVAATNAGTPPSYFNSYATLMSHVAGVVPSLESPTNLFGAGLSTDYNGEDTGFPALVQSNPNDFEALYTGAINITTGGTYTFGTASDDGSMVYIDGKAVVNNNYFQGEPGNNSGPQRTGQVTLSAGLHQITIGFYQGGGGYGLEAYYNGADTGGTTSLISNSVLTPSVIMGSLQGSGNVAITTASILEVGSDGTNQTYSGTISDVAGSGVTKTGSGTWTITLAQAYAGPTFLVGGTLQLGTGAAGNDGSLATSNIINNAALVYNLNGNQTASYPITGTGTLTKAGTGSARP